MPSSPSKFYADGYGVKYAVINAASGDNTLVAADAKKRFRVLSYVVITAATVTVRFESGAGGTALTGVMSLTADSPLSSGFNPAGHFETAVGSLLNLETNGDADGHLTYIELDE